ncbi:MAG: acyltransferase family protein, partial [Archangium sp.]|nr:acyltransferase family protein [Archangium sp.]
RRWAEGHGLLHPSYDGGTELLVRPLHLWFLLYLVLFSALAAPVVPSTPHRLVTWAGKTVAARPFVLVLLTPVTALTTVWVGEATPAFSFVPQLATVLTYGPCFAVGWALYSARDDLENLKPWWPSLLAGLALATWVTSRPIQWEPPGMWLSALATWLSVLGSLALAARPWKSNPVLQRAVEASYWVYLTHYPLVVAAQLSWAREPWPVWVKYALVILATTAVTFCTHALIRSARARRRAALASR